MNYSFWNEWTLYLSRLPDLLLGLLVLFVGWLVAKGVANALERILVKTKIDQKFFNESNETTQQKYSVSKWMSKTVYYLIIIYAFILFFNILELDFIATPLVNMMSGITAAVPSILKATLIFLLGWIIASFLKLVVNRLGRTLKIDAMLQKLKVTTSVDESNQLIDNASRIVFYLVLLIFLPGVLSALEIRGVSEPFSSMIDSLLAFVPKLFAAALVLIVGWVIARIVRDIVANFLKSIGVEKLTDRFGLTKLFEGTSVSAVIGTIAYVLILIPVVIAALDQLDMDGISQPAIAMLNDILTMLPNIAVAIVLVLVGLWLGKWIATFAQGLLSRLGFDSIVTNMGVGKYDPSQSKVTPSQLVGYIVQIVVALLFVVEALQVVQLQFLVVLGTGVIAYLPSLFAAIVILAIGLYVGNVLQKVLSNAFRGNEFKMLGSIAKYTVIAISLFMALDQLGVAASIVNSAFILILGGLALAFGLSFGLGGKDVAAKYLKKIDEKMEDVKPNDRTDV